MTAATIDTDLLLPTPPAGKTHDFTSLLAVMAAAINAHAVTLDVQDGNFDGPLTADAPGRARVDADFFDAATVLAKFATDSFDAAELLKLVKDGAFANDAATRALFADNVWTAAKLAAAVQVKIPGTNTLTAAAQAATHRDVTIQLKDVAGANVAAKTLARVWISDAAGGAATGTTPDAGFTVQTGTLLATVLTGKILDVISDATGVIVVRIDHAGADTTWYANVAVGAALASSAAILIDN